MFRLIGVFLIFSACCSMGLNISFSMKRKLERLETIRKMSNEIATLIRYRSLTVREIFLTLKENDIYSGLVFLHNADYSDKNFSVDKIWCKEVETDFTLSPEEKSILCELGNQLGTTDTEGQLSILEVFNKKIETMLEDQTEKYAVRGKLCRSMGILAGAMVGILII